MEAFNYFFLEQDFLEVISVELNCHEFDAAVAD